MLAVLSLLCLTINLALHLALMTGAHIFSETATHHGNATYISRCTWSHKGVAPLPENQSQQRPLASPSPKTRPSKTLIILLLLLMLLIAPISSEGAMAMTGDDEQPSLLLEDNMELGARRLPSATYAPMLRPTGENTTTKSSSDSPDRNPTLNRKRRKVPSPQLEDIVGPKDRSTIRESSSSYLNPPPISRAELEAAADDIQTQLLDQLSTNNDCVIDLEEGTRKHFEGLDAQLNEAVTKIHELKTSTVDTISGLTEQIRRLH